ncbi:type III pantothenate kinase [Thiomicrorhabdus sp. Kp2]|uniref:type III pantothenate kinase n=1 Tax=Thiomicrorhabdus sp. Kp2 TaxID=1123518 RepID=UPI0003FFBE90|nr:type III pantothenate kinase [Thiomicrorhabdus sp. Kp2]
MNKLFLDIGNSFIKWATVINDSYVLHEAISFDEIEKRGLAFFEIDGIPDVVYFSAVGDAHRIELLKRSIQTAWQIFPIQLSSQKECCDLTSGYDDFSQLGDDRWFAMLGAVGIYRDPVIVADAGTALTIDAIMNGKHLGGFIVPGLHTMRSSLALNTNDLPLFEDAKELGNDYRTQILATNTADGILGGTLYMTASFINQVVLDLNSQLQTRFKLIITGGESLKISSLIDYDFDYIPDLVLQGMVNVEESVKK